VAGDACGSTVAKRRLASRLAVMRQRTGMSLNEVSDKLGWSRGRLDRYERDGWRLPDASHVRDLARIYGVDADERSELEELGRLARERVWWRSYEDVFGKGNEFPGFENDATKISVHAAGAAGLAADAGVYEVVARRWALARAVAGAGGRGAAASPGDPGPD
jgi:transcriptional regulator with XRE-family HTH domain